jgi:hypothetical protein
MGSPLSPVTANYFMEYFEEMVLETAIFKQHIRHLATWTRQAG